MALADELLSPFIWGQGGQKRTPEQIARDREMAKALMGIDTSPVAHPLQGLARVAQAAAGAYRGYRADQAQKANDAASQASSLDMLQSVFGGGGSSGVTGTGFPAAPGSTGGMPSAPVADIASDRVSQAHGSPAPVVNISGSKQEFINALMPAAIEESKRIGVDPRIILGQAAQETGWGRKAPGNNYFGIKSHGKGGGQTFATHEYVNGKRVNIRDSFRQFASPADSVRGYGDFILQNPRYRALREAQGLDAQLAALQASGYATDPNYSRSVGAIARGIQLPDMASVPPVPQTGAEAIDAIAPQADQMAFAPEPPAAPYTPPVAGVPVAEDEAAIQALEAQMAGQSDTAFAAPVDPMATGAARLPADAYRDTSSPAVAEHEESIQALESQMHRQYDPVAFAVDPVAMRDPVTAAPQPNIPPGLLRPQMGPLQSFQQPAAPTPAAQGTPPMDPQMQIAQALTQLPVNEALPMMGGPTAQALPAPPSSGINPLVAQALSNPNASPQERQIAGILLQQQMAQQQAAQQAQQAQAQAAAAQAQRYQAANQAGINPNFATDDEIWKQAVQRQFRDPATSIQEYEYGVQNPGYFEQQERQKRAGATSVNNILGGEQLTPGQKKIDEAFADTYLGWNSGGFADSRKQLTQLGEALKILENGGDVTGAIGMLPTQLQPFINPEGTVARENVEEVVQRSLREILGAQFTEKEGERLIARAFNPLMSPQENAKRVRRLMTTIGSMADAKQDMVDYFDQNGTLRGYKGSRPTLGQIETLSSEFGESPEEGSGNAPDGVDPNDWKYMTPEERALFQ